MLILVSVVLIKYPSEKQFMVEGMSQFTVLGYGPSFVGSQGSLVTSMIKNTKNKGMMCENCDDPLLVLIPLRTQPQQ